MTSGDFDREGVGSINEALEEGRDKLLGQLDFITAIGTSALAGEGLRLEINEAKRMHGLAQEIGQIAAGLADVSGARLAALEQQAAAERRQEAEAYDEAFAIDTIVQHVMKVGTFTVSQLREYLRATEDFTEDQIKTMTRMSLLQKQIEARLATQDKKAYWVDAETMRGIDPTFPKTGKVYTLGVIEPPEAQVQPDQALVVSEYFSMVEMTKSSFSAESMQDQEREAAREFMLGLFETDDEEVLGKDMKKRVVDVMKNRHIGYEEAGMLLNKAYEAYLIGKKDIEQKVYYVSDPDQRRARRERVRQVSQERSNETPDYIALGAGELFAVLVDDLTHVQQRLSPDKISQLIEEKTGRTVSARTVKQIARGLQDYFSVREGSQGGKSPHAKSRGQKILTIGIRNQAVKESWKNDPQSILAQIKALHLSGDQV